MVTEPHVLGQHPGAENPSVSMGAKHLFAHGIFEEETRPNLAKPLTQLVPEGQPCIMTVNDKKLATPLRVQLKWIEQMKE